MKLGHINKRHRDEAPVRIRAGGEDPAVWAGGAAPSEVQETPGNWDILIT